MNGHIRLGINFITPKVIRFLTKVIELQIAIEPFKRIHIMKKLLILLLIPLEFWGQGNNETTQLQFHHLGITLGGGSVQGFQSIVNFSFEAGVNLNKHLVKGSILFGSDLDIFRSTKDADIQEYNLQYGREFPIGDWFYLEGYAGMGYFGLRKVNPNDISTTVSQSAIGFPLEVTARFDLIRRISLGIQLHQNFNSLAHITAVGLHIRYNFQ